jgi:hypothetical protein
VPDSNQLRQKLASTAKDRSRAEERRAAAHRAEAKHRAEAAKYRAQAAKASSASSIKSRLDNAEREERAARSQTDKAADAAKEAARCSAQEAGCQRDLARAIEQEGRSAQKKKRERDAARDAREREQNAANLERSLDHARYSERAWTLGLVEDAMAQIAPPKAEKLRVLYLTASSDGSLRVDEEIRRVKAAVRASTHRDLIDIEHLPAATPSDLLDGLARHRPHVVHFSGHASSDMLVFDSGGDTQGPGHQLDASLFARALGAVDAPPQLVVLNACDSQGHYAWLRDVVPFVVSMTASIGDTDAITFATRFYTAIAEGQSIQGALNLARVQMLFTGLADDQVPALSCAGHLDPTQVILVLPPE